MDSNSLSRRDFPHFASISSGQIFSGRIPERLEPPQNRRALSDHERQLRKALSPTAPRKEQGRLHQAASSTVREAKRFLALNLSLILFQDQIC